MPGMKEYGYTWTFTSTGTGTFIDAGWADDHSFYAETAGGSTASLQFLTRRNGSTVTFNLGSSATLAAVANTVVRLTGALDEVAPRIKTLTSTGTVYVQVLGQS